MGRMEEAGVGKNGGSRSNRKGDGRMKVEEEHGKGRGRRLKEEIPYDVYVMIQM